MPRTLVVTLAALALLGCRPVASNQALLAEYDGSKYESDPPSFGCANHFVAPPDPSECLDYAVIELGICLEHDEAPPSRAAIDELVRTLVVEYRDTGLSVDDADEVVAIAESIGGVPLAAAVRRCFDDPPGRGSASRRGTPPPSRWAALIGRGFCGCRAG